MKRVILILLLLILLLGGCKTPEREAYYGFFYSEHIVLVVEGKHMVIMRIPSSIVDGYAAAMGIEDDEAIEDLVGISATGSFGTDYQGLQELSSLVITLASEIRGIGREEVSDELALEVLVEHASDLRKTQFVSTLQRLTGLPGGLALLQKMKVCHTYDVGQFVTIDTTTDWKFVQQYLSRWLTSALLLE